MCVAGRKHAELRGQDLPGAGLVMEHSLEEAGLELMGQMMNRVWERLEAPESKGWDLRIRPGHKGTNWYPS